MKFVGDRLLRKEDPRLVQGRGRYVGDIALPGMLHAAFVRSPHAHARLGAINADRVLKVPGVVAVVTGADLGEAGRSLPIVPPHAALRGQNFCLLASDRARFVGEAVAVVVAESRNAAEDGRAQIDVDWEPLPSVQDPTAPGPARVHEDIPDNLAGRVTLSRGQVATALPLAWQTVRADGPDQIPVRAEHAHASRAVFHRIDIAGAVDRHAVGHLQPLVEVADWGRHTSGIERVLAQHAGPGHVQSVPVGRHRDAVGLVQRGVDHAHLAVGSDAIHARSALNATGGRLKIRIGKVQVAVAAQHQIVR